MTRIMYDSVTPGAIPTTAAMVAGYVDGRYAWSAADWARWGPSTVKVRIAVFPSTNDGHVLDVEQGDATPAQAPGWVLMRRQAGIDPSVYTGQSQWADVRAAFQTTGVAEPHYWIAAYPGDGPDTIPAGAHAHQFADPPASGGQWDLSVVADYWPGVDDPNGATVTPDEILAILNYPIKREGPGASGTTSLLAMAAWSDAQIVAMHNDIATVRGDVEAIATKVAALSAPTVTVDLDALAAKVAAHINLTGTVTATGKPGPTA